MVWITRLCMITKMMMVGMVVISAAAMVAPMRPRSEVPVPPAMVCSARGRVYIAWLWM